jgi:hypothetical protein
MPLLIFGSMVVDPSYQRQGLRGAKVRVHQDFVPCIELSALPTPNVNEGDDHE